jgi:hypothetical protein
VVAFGGEEIEELLANVAGGWERHGRRAPGSGRTA